MTGLGNYLNIHHNAYISVSNMHHLQSSTSQKNLMCQLSAELKYMLGAQVIFPSLLTRWHCFVGFLRQVFAAEWTPITHCRAAVWHDRLDVQFEHCWPFLVYLGVNQRKKPEREEEDNIYWWDFCQNALALACSVIINWPVWNVW